MEAVAAPISFDAISQEVLATFHRQREKILTAVCERVATSPAFSELAADNARMRIAHESSKILIENFYATAKYRLPGALLEYLDWLRGYLGSRDFPPTFIVALLGGIRQGAAAFLEPGVGAAKAAERGTVLGHPHSRPHPHRHGVGRESQRHRRRTRGDADHQDCTRLQGGDGRGT